MLAHAGEYSVISRISRESGVSRPTRPAFPRAEIQRLHATVRAALSEVLTFVEPVARVQQNLYVVLLPKPQEVVV